MSDIFEEFRRLVSRFNSEQIDYAVCGGWALAIHGAPRATVDMDFLLVTKGLKEVWSEREVFDWEDEKVTTISREGLIYMKQISGRQKDLSDIESLRKIENES